MAWEVNYYLTEGRLILSTHLLYQKTSIMLLSLWVLRYSLPRDAMLRATYLGYVHRGLELKMETFAGDVGRQGLAQGPMDGGTVVIRCVSCFFSLPYLCETFSCSSGLHSLPTCLQNHLTIQLFVSTDEYAGVAVGLHNLPLVRIRNSHLGVAESSFV